MWAFYLWGDNMSMISVNGVVLPTPSAYSYGLQDISGTDAGRALDEKATMYKNKKCQKVKISLAWNGISPEVCSQILLAIDDEYFDVTYVDAKLNQNLTKTFYVGDRTAPVKQWIVNNKMYSQLSFDIIER